MTRKKTRRSLSALEMEIALNQTPMREPRLTGKSPACRQMRVRKVVGDKSVADPQLTRLPQVALAARLTLLQHMGEMSACQFYSRAEQALPRKQGALREIECEPNVAGCYAQAKVLEEFMRSGHRKAVGQLDSGRFNEVFGATKGCLQSQA